MKRKSISSLYKIMCDASSMTMVDDKRSADNNIKSNIELKNGIDGSVLSLDDSITIILWRTFPESRVGISLNFSTPVIVCNKRWNQKGTTELHRHDFIEIVYVIKGEYNLMIAGERHTFSQGSVCIIDKNSEHCECLYDQDNFIAFICMKNDFFDELFLAEVDDGNVQQIIRKPLLKQQHTKQFLRFKMRDGNDMIYSLINMIAMERYENKKGTKYIIKGLIIRLFEILTNNYDIDLSESTIKNINDSIFLEVDEYLRNNYKDVSLKALADRFHFQEDYFSRLIKKNTGLTYSEHLRKIRISKAEELLLNTHMSVCSIIDFIGYENRHHFYSLFYDYHKMTPEQYRKSYTSNFKDFYNDDMTYNFNFDFKK